MPLSATCIYPVPVDVTHCSLTRYYPPKIYLPSYLPYLHSILPPPPTTVFLLIRPSASSNKVNVISDACRLVSYLCCVCESLPLAPHLPPSLYLSLSSPSGCLVLLNAVVGRIGGPDSSKPLNHSRQQNIHRVSVSWHTLEKSAAFQST